MAISANDLTSANGLFKIVYADKMTELVPDGVKLLNLIKFSEKDSTGASYNVPVVLKQEQGMAFASSSEDVFALAPPISAYVQQASVQGTQVLLRSAIGYATLFRSVKAGEKAFKSATKYVVQNMLKSLSKQSEAMILYGQVGLGTVASVASANTVITVTTAEWAVGLWAGSEDMPLEVYDVTLTTKRGEASLKSVDFDNRALTLNQAIAGLTATDVILRKGTFGKEFAGVHKILTNTGTIFGISAADYSLWKGNTYAAGSAALSFNKIQDAIARAVEKGLEQKVCVFVNPRTWADLLTEQAALRMYDQSYSTSVAENGSKSIKFHGQNGEIEIISSNYVKEGYAYCLAVEEWSRIGSTEMTFKRPGMSGEDDFLRDLSEHSAMEMRLYQDWALFTSLPCLNVLISGIVN